MDKAGDVAAQVEQRMQLDHRFGRTKRSPRKSSGFKQNAFLSCWVPACAGMTGLFVMNDGNINKFEKGNKTEGISCRLAEYIPPAAPGRKSKAQLSTS